MANDALTLYWSKNFHVDFRRHCINCWWSCSNWHNFSGCSIGSSSTNCGHRCTDHRNWLCCIFGWQKHFQTGKILLICTLDTQFIFNSRFPSEVDRSKHEQTINVTDNEARSHWLGLVAGAVGLSAGAATKGLASAASRGSNISKVCSRKKLEKVFTTKKDVIFKHFRWLPDP